MKMQNLQVTTNVGTIWISCDAPTDPGWIGIKAWASTSRGFVPDDLLNLLGRVNANVVCFGSFHRGHGPVLSNATYYVRVATYGTSGESDVSEEFQVRTS